MSQRVVMEEFHLKITAPGGLTASVYRAMRRALDRQSLQDELRKATAAILQKRRSLVSIRVTLTR